ncbi:MAG: radical SAM protein [Methanomassiliicoccales archaeon]|nr:MAG: radical SAM protein [Methanomassiliicoccales archaeon]
MTNITGMKKNVLLLKMLKNERVRNLPKSFLFYLKDALKYEKFVELDGKYVLTSQMPPYPGEAFDQFMQIGAMAMEGKAAPASCHIAVTNKCNYDCWHCSNYNREDAEDLPLDLLLKTVDELQDMGNCIIGITGGEPLLREDLTDFVRGIGPKSCVMLFTTGDGLTKEKTKELKDAGLFSIVISLDHYKPELHDEVRGCEGAFATAIDAIKHAIEEGLFTVVSAVPKREWITNGDIWKFMDFVNDLGVHEVRFLAPIPTGRIVGQQELRWKKEEREEMWRLHKKMNTSKDYPRVTVFSLIESEGILGCTAGFYHMFIEGDGTVTPCDMIPLSFGNIKDEGGVKSAFERMTQSYTMPRNKCFLRAAVKLIGKAYEEEGKLPLTQEKSVEIYNRVPNRQCSEFFEKLGMPQALASEKEKKKD